MHEREVSDGPLDIVYLFRHSRHGDEEMRYSLRSVAANAAFIRKVWVFGSRPAFLSDDRSVIEHVPHEFLPATGWSTGGFIYDEDIPYREDEPEGGRGILRLR